MSGDSIGRLQQIRLALDSVTDPEIDESVVSLDFISDVRIDEENRVEIEIPVAYLLVCAEFRFSDG
jgi:metal-sulfur cluster biosynthetic enzyme